MDAFYVAVELLRRPDLRGLPVIVAGRGPRAVVTTASYEARPFGVGSAMPVAHAKRRCPDLVHLPVDMAHYRERSAEVMGLVGELGVPTQPVSLDEVYLDLSATPDPVARMSDLVRAIPSGSISTPRSGSVPTAWSPRSPRTPRSRAASASSPASRPQSASPPSRRG